MSFAPVQLGCCPEVLRCRLCGPPPQPVDADYVAALRESVGPDAQVCFFGGPPPSPSLLRAAGLDARVRVRPDLLDRAQASDLAAAGVRSIELDALSLNDSVLKGIRRRYRGARIKLMAEGIRGLGLEVGIVLAVGLPGSSHHHALDDITEAVRWVDTVRIHPVLVVRRSDLWRAHLDGLYEPLSLSQAVTTCRAMMDVADDAGVPVIRVGQQAGPDELGRVVAGPAHSSLRELVEARRTLDTLRQIFRASQLTPRIAIRCAPEDETRTRGPLNDNIRTLRAEFMLRELTVHPDPNLLRGDFSLEDA